MIDSFEIKYRKIPVKVSIKGKIGIVECNFILDTGASHTIINEEFIKTIGYSRKDIESTEFLRGFGKKNVNEIPFLLVKSFLCLGLVRRNFNLGFCEFSSSIFYDGILGVDFLLNHKLCIDFKKGTIELD